MKMANIRKFPERIETDAERDALRIGAELGDFYQEMEMSSRYVNASQHISIENSSVSLHSHSFYEIIYCCSNCGMEYLVGANRYRIQKGDIVIVPSGVSHRPLLPDELTTPYKRYIMRLSNEFLNNLALDFPEARFQLASGVRLIRTAGTKWEFLGELFWQGVLEAENQDIGWETALIGNTIHLIVQLHRAILDEDAEPLPAEKPDLLDQVLAYVENHLDEKISLSDVAKQFWVSQSTISQTFRNKMGVSFYRCVTQQRLITAKSLITLDIPLEMISEQVGFSDYSTFYRAFKQEFGISPRQYRKRQEQTE